MTQVVIIVLSLLMLYTSSVAASCAWLLWSVHLESVGDDALNIPVGTVEFKVKSWNVEKAHETYDQCQQDIRSNTSFEASRSYAQSKGYDIIGNGILAPFKFQLTVSRKPLVVVGW